jgi:predicted aspartyl protease
MIRGTVNAKHEGTLQLRVRGPVGIELAIDFVIDTGLSAPVTLSTTDISTLGLTRISTSYAVLADGSVSHFGVFAAEVFWAGAWRPVLVSGMGGEALIGMGILAGHSLLMEIKPGGNVEISALP